MAPTRRCRCWESGAGNAIYLVDGMPNRSEFGGGPSTQFTLGSIFEFEVITDGYKAEFGHGSGGVINVVTKSGQERLARHGGRLPFATMRSTPRTGWTPTRTTPELDRLGRGGGPPAGHWSRTASYLFASAEAIEEDRELNFSFPPATPQSVRDFELAFDNPAHSEDTRLFAPFDEQIGYRATGSPRR